MPFDEQLRRVLDAALAELTQVAQADAQHAREQGLEEGRTRGFEEGHARGVEEGHARGVEEGHARGLEEGHARGLEEGHARGVQDGHAKGLEEGRAQGWDDGREQGRFEAEQEIKASAAPAANTSALERLLDACRTLDRARTLSEALDAAAACAGREAGRSAVLIVRDARIRSWRFVGFDSSMRETSFQSHVDGSGVVDQAIRSRAAATAEDVPAFAVEGASAGGSFAFPLEVAGEVVAVLYADGLDGDTQPGAELRLETIGRHAARAIEALTALKAARAIAAPADTRTATDDDAEASARRYAKLLVSEIKLYHEPAVIAGRRDRDLASRLGGEIARARVLYEERVPHGVRMRADYFRDELVKTLANGDATLLHLT